MRSIEKEDLLTLINDVVRGVAGDSSLTISEEDGSETIEAWDSLVSVALASGISDELELQVDAEDLDYFSSVAGIFKLVGVD